MESKMVFVNYETKQTITIETDQRVKRFGEILSSVIMNRSNLVDDISKMSNLNISFTPSEEEIEKKKPEKVSKSKMTISDNTLLILDLAQILMKTTIQLIQISSQNPIEQNYKRTASNTTLTLNFPVLLAINEIILKFLTQKNQKQNQNKEVLSVIHKLKTNEIDLLGKESSWGGQKNNASLYKMLFEVDSLNIAFSSYNNMIDKEEMDVSSKKILYKAIRFFFYFFPFIFIKVSHVFIDYNVYELISLYQKEKNPYLFSVGKMEEESSDYDHIFLANLFTSIELNKLGSMKDLKLKLNESFIIDSQCLLYIKDLIFIKHLLHIDYIESLTLIYNCLDPLLFQKLIHLLIINRGLKTLVLDMFPKELVNSRKIQFNALYFNLSLENNDKIITPIETTDVDIDYIHLQSLLEEGKQVLQKEKVVKYLFKGFDTNLRHLLFVLEIMLESLQVFKIEINPYVDLLEYDSYNTAISLFIFNLFLILNYKTAEKNLLEVKIILKAEEYSLLISQSINRYHNKKRFGLDLINLQKVYLSMPNIRVFLDFNRLPYDTLKELKLKKLSYEDFNELQIALKNNKDRFDKGEFILISLDYWNKIDFNLIGKFFRESLPIKYSELFFEFPFDLTLDQLINDIINNILIDMRQKYIDSKIKIKMIIKCKIKEFVDLIGNSNNMKYKAAVEFNNKLKHIPWIEFKLKIPDRFSFELNLIQLNKDEVLYSALFALNRVINNCSMNTKMKIVKNIFYYMNAKRLFLRLYMI